MRVVAVRWCDSHDIAPGEWITEGEVDPGMEVLTVGHLISKTKRHVVIAHSVADNGDLRGCFVIPRSSVLSFRRLKGFT